MARERRQFPRVPQPFEVRYRLSGELGESWKAVTTVNLSAGGVRFRDTELLTIGDALEIQIHLPGARETLTFQGRVAWSQMQASGVTENGVEFVDATAAEQQRIDNLVQFLRRSEPPSAPQT